MERPAIANRQQSEESRGEAQYRTDGEIDAAGQDHQRHADGEQAVFAVLVENVGLRPPGEKDREIGTGCARREEAADNKHD